MQRRLSASPGVALLLALAVVIVLAAFLSELFLDTGLEVHALQNLRDSGQARLLARSAFKAVERLIRDKSEQDFVTAFRRVDALLKVSALPFEGAYLTRLQVESLDGKFNVNELGKQRPGQPEDTLRWSIFRSLLTAISLQGEGEHRAPLPITDIQIAGLYSALVDWIDPDDDEYRAQGVPGAERQSYAAAVPPFRIKNAMLDRLEEVRLIQGWAEAGVPWPEFEKRFAVLPRSGSGGDNYLPEKLDVNLASREQIARWLTEHRIEDPVVLSSPFGTVQRNLNTLADRADAVAAALAPDEFDRRIYIDAGAIQKALVDGGIQAVNPGQFFGTCSTYLQVRITVDVNGTVSTLTALLKVKRDNSCGKASNTDILSYSLS